MSAVLLTLAQSPFDVGALATVALVPWLLALRWASPLVSAALGLLFGVLFVCFSASWVRPAFEAMGAYGFHATLGTLLVAVWAKGGLFAAVGL